jgi:hypothetical protein
MNEMNPPLRPNYKSGHALAMGAELVRGKSVTQILKPLEKF